MYSCRAKRLMGKRTADQLCFFFSFNQQPNLSHDPFVYLRRLNRTFSLQIVLAQQLLSISHSFVGLLFPGAALYRRGHNARFNFHRPCFCKTVFCCQITSKEWRHLTWWRSAVERMEKEVCHPDSLSRKRSYLFVVEFTFGNWTSQDVLFFCFFPKGENQVLSVQE